jgi:outer membrane protein
MRPSSRLARRLAPRAASAAALLAAGCALAPSRWVADRSPPSASEPVAVPAPPPAPPSAPEAPPAAPRSLEDLVALALAHAPSTRAAWHDARAAAAESGAARGAYLPSLDATGTFGRAQVPGGPARSASVATAGGVSATLSWLLLDLGQRSAFVRAADRLALAASLAHRTAVQDLVLRVQSGYYQLLAARGLVAAQRANVKATETNLAAAEDRRRAGVATIADVLQARTAASQAKLVLQQLEGNALVVRGQLATLVGLPTTAELEVGELPERVAVDRAAPEVEALLAEAAAQNPDLARARALADASSAQATAAARAGLPTLSGQASVGRTWYVDPSVGPQDGWSAGLVLSVPLFTGLETLYTSRAARESADAARARAEATGEAVAVGVWSSYQSVRTAVRRVETSRDLLESATASSEVAAARYKEGVGSILDLLNAQSSLAVARAEDVIARTDFFLSLANLARATGRLEPIPAVPAAPASPAPDGARRP